MVEFDSDHTEFCVILPPILRQKPPKLGRFDVKPLPVFLFILGASNIGRDGIELQVHVGFSQV